MFRVGGAVSGWMRSRVEKYLKFIFLRYIESICGIGRALPPPPPIPSSLHQFIARHQLADSASFSSVQSQFQHDSGILQQRQQLQFIRRLSSSGSCGCCCRGKSSLVRAASGQTLRLRDDRRVWKLPDPAFLLLAQASIRHFHGSIQAGLLSRFVLSIVCQQWQRDFAF